LEQHEVALLTNMATSVQEMLDERQAGSPSDPLEALTGIRTGNPAPPQDGTMRRLLPDFVKDQKDEDGSNSALRSLHEPQIIDAKIAAAQRLVDTLPVGGGRLELTEGDVEAWIAAVNDIRLALGTILGIGTDTPDRLPDGHPMYGLDNLLLSPHCADQMWNQSLYIHWINSRFDTYCYSH
jgi:hypothetical protein